MAELPGDRRHNMMARLTEEDRLLVQRVLDEAAIRSSARETPLLYLAA